MRRTPYARLRYPWASDTVSAADVQAMAADIDQALVTTSLMGADFSLFGSVVAQRSAAQSLTKGALTAISFDSILLNNGANSPLANGAWWSNANPTRLTAPAPCVVLASGSGGISIGSALGTSGVVQVTIAQNGAATGQGSKWAPVSTVTGQQWTSALSMWRMNTGDYLELKMYWTGTPAGPFNTDTVVKPLLSLMMVGLQTVS